MGGRALIAGVGYAALGRNLGRTEGSLTVEACLAAIADAGLSVGDIDGLVTYPERIASPFEGPPLIYVQRALGLARLRYWQSFGTGPGPLAAVVGAVQAVASGSADVVLCYRGHRRQTQPFYIPGRRKETETAELDQAFKAPYGAPAGAPRWALWACRYMHETGATEDDLAEVVLTCREHAQQNPRAVWYGHPLTREEYFRSPYVATPLRLVDCDLPVDGAVAVIVASASRATATRKPIRIEAVGHATGPDVGWDVGADLSRMASQQASEELWARTTLRPSDLDLAQVYDGFSSLALCWLEDLGICGRGEAGAFLRSGAGRVGGRLPICTDGGELGVGRQHGMGKLAETVVQLRSEAGDRQVRDAEVGAVCAGAGPNCAVFLLTR